MSEKTLRALIVDDSALIRQMVKSSVRAVGIKDMTEAKNGKEAMASLNAQKYDIVILDWVMPEMTGIEVAEAVRNGNGINSAVPILMVTAEASKDKVLRIASMKINGYVVKPFTCETLEKKLAILIKRIKENRS